MNKPIASKIIQAAGCPGCGTKLRYRFDIRLRAVRQIDGVAESLMQSDTRLAVEEEGYKTSAAQCPCCQQFFQLLLDIKVLRAIPVAESHVPVKAAASAAKQPTASELKLMARLDKTDLLYAFKQAVIKEQFPVPANMTTYFATWLRLASPMRVAARVLERYKFEFKTTEIEFWQVSRVVSVVADGEIRSFLPRSTIEEQSKAARLAPEVAGASYLAEVWRKTRFGYVTGRGFYMDEMRKRASGEFAKAANL